MKKAAITSETFEDAYSLTWCCTERTGQWLENMHVIHFLTTLKTTGTTTFLKESNGNVHVPSLYMPYIHYIYTFYETI